MPLGVSAAANGKDGGGNGVESALGFALAHSRLLATDAESGYGSEVGPGSGLADEDSNEGGGDDSGGDDGSDGGDDPGGGDDDSDGGDDSSGAGGCVGDLDSDGEVTGADLGLMLGAWGSSHSRADLNHDGEVNAADLGLLLGNFGACQ